MCGVFGFISKGGSPDLNRLRSIAIATQTRGLHAFGLAWQKQGIISYYKRKGSAASDLSDIDLVAGARIVIGHCRYATHGSPDVEDNNHPHFSGNGAYVHNGVVLNYESLCDIHGLEMKTECDSEVLGLMIDKMKGSLIERVTRTATEAEGRLVILGLWKNKLVIARRDNPLYFGQDCDGIYFGSLPNAIPNAKEFPNFSVRLMVIGHMEREENAIIPELFSRYKM